MFYKQKFKLLEHALNDMSNDINATYEKIAKIYTKLNFLEKSLTETQEVLNELEEKSKNKWETTTKRVETCEKANEMFIKALNEQRDVIRKIIKYLNNNSKTTKTTKKGK